MRKADNQRNLNKTLKVSFEVFCKTKYLCFLLLDFIFKINTVTVCFTCFILPYYY